MGSESAVSFVGKITTASVGLKTLEVEKLAIAAKGAEVPVMRVGGFIKSTESATGQFGPYTIFRGEFEATNLVSGQKYRSGRMLLPTIAEVAIGDDATSMEEGSKLAFGLDLTAVEHVTTKPGVKFRWGVKPLIEPREDDEVSKLMKSMTAPKQIAAPKSKK